MMIDSKHTLNLPFYIRGNWGFLLEPAHFQTWQWRECLVGTPFVDCIYGQRVP